MPSTIDELAKVEVEYLTMKGFLLFLIYIIVGNRTYLELLNFQNYPKPLKIMLIKSKNYLKFQSDG